MRIRLALLMICAPQALLAAEIEVVSRIERVTVYPDAALVSRTGSLSLPEGASSLTLRGLPATLDPSSIQVSAKGGGALTLGAVDVRLTPGEAKPVVDAALQEKIDRLREEREVKAAGLVALEGKRKAIERYAEASPEKLGPEGKGMEVGQWQTAWDAIGSGLAGVQEDIRQARAKLRDLDAEILAAERARPSRPSPGAPKRDVSIAVEAASAMQGEILVSYRVAGASWRPTYEASLDTGAEKPVLDLARRAEISQRTGEDWSDVELSVSTVRIARGAAAAELAPLQVSFWEPPAFAERERAARSLAVPAPAAPSADGQQVAELKKAVPPAPRMVEAAQQQATLEAGSFQATYRVPGRVSVGQDGLSKTLALATRRIEPQLSVAATPELDETAYLKASFTHEDEAPLLPGEVSLRRDGSFVGRTRIKLTAPGDSVDLGLGADDRVKIARVPLRRRESEPTWLGQTKTDLREFKTSVKNLHAQAIRITILDRMPYSENGAITVEQLRETTAPTEKQPNDRRGVLAWSYDYKPGEARDIRLSYRLRWPADRDVVFEQKPVSRP